MSEHEEIMKLASQAKPVSPQQVYNLVDSLVAKSTKELGAKIDRLQTTVEALAKKLSKKE